MWVGVVAILAGLLCFSFTVDAGRLLPSLWRGDDHPRLSSYMGPAGRLLSVSECNCVTVMVFFGGWA